MAKCGVCLMVFKVLLVIYFLMLNYEQDIHQRPRVVARYAPQIINMVNKLNSVEILPPQCP